MNKEELIEKISSEGWLENVDIENIARILEFSEVRKYQSGEFLYLVGDTQNHIFCILDGRVKISIVNQEGEEFVLTIWERGYWFGESSFLKGSTMPSIDKVMENSVEFYRNVFQDMIRRATELYGLVEMLLFKPLQVRVAARMLHLINLYGQESAAGIILPLQFSQADFARMSGGSRQRVNKVFRQWASEGVVSKKGKNYIVHDMVRLRAALELTEEA